MHLDLLTADVLELTGGRSLVLVTHRLAALESVEEILVMEAGRVAERGTHDELLGGAGRYSRLWWKEMRAERYTTSRQNVPQHLLPHPRAGTAPGVLNDGSST